MQPPLVEGEHLPDFWCRIDGDETILVFAHPAARRIRYPMPYGEPELQTEPRTLTPDAAGRRLPIEPIVAPGESLLVTVADNIVKITPRQAPGSICATVDRSSNASLAASRFARGGIRLHEP